MCNCSSIKIPIPMSTEYIQIGDVITLGRFKEERWAVKFGWYSYAGNREVFGIYLSSVSNDKVRPLQKPDLVDIIIISHGGIVC